MKNIHSQKSIKRIACLLMCMILALLTYSCGPVYYQLTAESIGTQPAILKNWGEHWTIFGRISPLLLHLIDEKDSEDFVLKGRNLPNSFNQIWNHLFEVELTPGLHVLKVMYTDLYTTSDTITMSFVALPGHTYLIESGVPEYSDTWSPTIKDITDEGHQQEVNVKFLP